MARERWKFDGWELTEGIVRDWAYRGGTGETAEFVGEDTTIPGRPGTLWRPKLQGAIRFTLDVWMRGSTREEVMAQYNLMLRAMRRRHRLVTVERTLANGEVVTCDAQVIGQIIPTYLSQQVWKASITFTVPAGAWKSVAVYSHKSTQVNAVFPKTLALTDLEPSTEGIDELEVLIHGPGSNITVEDITDGIGEGHFVRYLPNLLSSQMIVLKSRTWEMSAGTNTNPNDNAWFQPHAVVYSGHRFLPVAAAPPGRVPTIRISGTGCTTSTYVQVTGRRMYAV